MEPAVRYPAMPVVEPVTVNEREQWCVSVVGVMEGSVRSTLICSSVT